MKTLCITLLVLAWLSAPSLVSAEPGGRHASLLKEGSYQFYFYHMNSRQDMTLFNDVLIGHQLNELENRTHSQLTWAQGFGVSCGMSIADNWYLSLSLEVLTRRLNDRQQRLHPNPDTQIDERVSDEHIIEYDTTTVRADLKRQFDLKFALFGLGAGVEVYGTSLSITREIDGVVVEDYGTGTGEFDTPDWSDEPVEKYDVRYTIAGRVLASLTAVVAGPILVNAEGGYRLASSDHLNSRKSNWYWNSPTGPVRASMNTSGFYWQVGVGFYLK